MFSTISHQLKKPQGSYLALFQEENAWPILFTWLLSSTYMEEESPGEFEQM